MLCACIAVSPSRYSTPARSDSVVTAKQKPGRPVVLSPVHSHNRTDSRHPNLRLTRSPHVPSKIAYGSSQGPIRTYPSAKDQEISVPNNSMGRSMFQQSSASSPSQIELPSLNTDDFLGLGMGPLSPGPSFTAMQGPWDIHHQMTPGHEKASQSSDAPSSYEEESPEAWTTRLASLAIRALHTGKQLSPSDNSAPLTVSSPQVEEVFDATSTLLRILDSVSAALHVSSSSSPEPLASSEPTDNAALTQDPGLIFLILACHQRLLDSFQAVCSSIRRSLRSVSHNNSGRGILHSTLPRKRTLHGDEERPCAAQFVMVLQLVSHLLSQLDRALNPSSTSSSSFLPLLSHKRHESRSSFGDDFAPTTDPDASSPSWTSMIAPGSSSSGSQGGDAALFSLTHEPDVDRRGSSDSSNRQSFMGLAKGALMTVLDQHTTLNNEIRELQESIDKISRL